MSEVLHGAFTEVLTDPVPVDEWYHRVESYGQDYMTMGAGPLSAVLVADMVGIHHCVADERVWLPPPG